MRYNRFVFAAVPLAVAMSAALTVTPVHAQSLTTTFSSNNSENGNMFDVTAFNNITITSFAINKRTTTPEMVEVYYKSGTYVGSETNAAAFTLLGSSLVTGGGSDTPTPLPVGGLNLVAGNTYGLYVTIAGPPGNDDADHQLLYTNGSNTYTNADLKITTGIGVAYPFGFGGIFPSRTWNGTIFYTPAAVPEPGSIALLTGMGVVGAGFLRRRKQNAHKAA